MKKYSKKSLKAKLTEERRKIKSLSTDKKATNAMLDELLSLQSQIDIEPTELYVPEADVIATYDFDAFSIMRCKTCVIFKCNGYRLVAKPLYNQGVEGGVLYNHLVTLCEMKEKFNDVDKETQDLYSLVFNMTILILSLPLDVFSNDKFLFDVATYIAKRKNEYYKELLETKLKDETVEDEIKNEQFKEMVMDSQKIKEDKE